MGQCLGDKRALTCAGLACLGALALGLVAQAEPEPAGLLINRDGDNVTVTLDSTASPDVSIHRTDDVMVIHVPKTFDARLLIDPTLKGGPAAVVQEAETGQGKDITIHSQQIYLKTQERPFETPVPAPTPKEKPTAASKPEHPTTSTLRMETTQPHVVKPGAMRAPASVSPPARASAPSSPSLSLPDIAKALQAEETRVPPARASAPFSSAKPATALPPVASGSQGTLSSASSTDPEAQPLALSGAQSPALAHSSGALWRIVLSLLTVLSLLLGFVKGVLPRLMARFPAFFERLQKGAALSAVPSAVVETTTVQPLPLAVPESEAPPFASFGADGNGPRRFLEKMTPGGQFCQVLGTTPLGKGKELHLVDLGGRKLVIATTPYTVSLIQEWRDAEDTVADSAALTVPRVSAAIEDDRFPALKPYASKPAGQTPHLPPTEAPPTASAPTPGPTWVDAEEVVVLEDYDDVFGG